MDSSDLWNRFSHWLCDERKKSNNRKSRELHCLNCSIEELCCAFCNWGLLIANSETLPVIASNSCARRVGTWICIMLILVCVSHYTELTWEVHKYLIFRLGVNVSCQCEEGRRLSLQWLSILEKKKIERYCPLHLRTRGILYEFWAGGESAAHRIIGIALGMS